MKHVIANLKMHMVSSEACEQYLVTLRDVFRRGEGVRLTVCPSTIFLERFANGLPEGVFLGAQNAFWETKGSFTGETSPLALKNVGVSSILLGHSERRAHVGETDGMIALKVNAAAENALSAIVCVGETLEERERGLTVETVSEQVAAALRDVTLERIGLVTIAYEPRWSIGTGRVPASAEIAAVRETIRLVLAHRYGQEAGSRVPVLYGGSVKAGLVRDVCLDSGMDGCLIGRESLNPIDLMAIVDAMRA
jgi:triosephosphate isomerase